MDLNQIFQTEHRYDDIIHMPHFQSKTKPHMSLHDRAAQFAPFSALTGHEDAIEETAKEHTEFMGRRETEWIDSI